MVNLHEKVELLKFLQKNINYHAQLPLGMSWGLRLFNSLWGIMAISFENWKSKYLLPKKWFFHQFNKMLMKKNLSLTESWTWTSWFKVHHSTDELSSFIQNCHLNSRVEQQAYQYIPVSGSFLKILALKVIVIPTFFWWKLRTATYVKVFQIKLRFALRRSVTEIFEFLLFFKLGRGILIFKFQKKLPKFPKVN